MPNCSAVLCYNEKKKGCTQTFHRFPLSRPDVASRWVLNMRRDKWKPKRESLLCSDHFEHSCFDRTGQTVRLHPDAVPTIFNCPAHLQKVPKRRKSPNERTSSLQVPKTEQFNFSGYNRTREHHYHRSPPRCGKRTGGDEVTSADTELPRESKRLKPSVPPLSDTSAQTAKPSQARAISLTEIVNELKELHLLSSNATHMLEKSFATIPPSLQQRLLLDKDLQKKTRGDKCPTEFRCFATTLQFYSATAYEYVRETFAVPLPHSSRVRRWYGADDGEPGFTKESFVVLHREIEAAAMNGKELSFSLMLDETSLKKHIEMDCRRVRGYVDVGLNIWDDDLPVASEALVMMVVCLNAPWKLPLAYFLTNGLTGEERANLVKECLRRLHYIGTNVVSLTLGGPSCHFSMAKSLGAVMQLPDPVAWFPNPEDRSRKIYVILDVRYMLQLLRGTWEQSRVFTDCNNNAISWRYVCALQSFQKATGLRGGHITLSSNQSDWFEQKMKVNVVEQPISDSVADLMEFCCKHSQLPQFEGCAATVTFIRLFSRLFDLLNSQNPYAKGFKSPLKRDSIGQWLPFLEDAIVYITSLKDRSFLPLYLSPWKTPFIAFAVCAASVKALANDLIAVENPQLGYLMTSKFSQDHLELFFRALRVGGRWNDSPTAKQFVGAYRAHLVHHRYVPTATVLDTTLVLRVKGTLVKQTVTYDVTDANYSYRSGLQCRSIVSRGCDDTDIPLYVPDVGDYAEYAIFGIARFAVRMAEKCIGCGTCIAALNREGNLRAPTTLMPKTGLRFPSTHAVQLCLCAERHFRQMLRMESSSAPKCNVRWQTSIGLSVLEDVGHRAFPSLAEHVFETPIENNHVFRLIKTVAQCYATIRLHFLTRSNELLPLAEHDSLLLRPLESSTDCMILWRRALFEKKTRETETLTSFYS